jgi:hypothetical protein
MYLIQCMTSMALLHASSSECLPQRLSQVGTRVYLRFNPFVTSGTYTCMYVPLTESLFKSAEITVSHFFSLFRWTSQNAFSRVRMMLCAMLHAALHTVSFVHSCFAGKCILTGSTEQRYFKVDGGMENNWVTVIPADFKRLVSGIYMFRWSQKG